MEIDSSAPGTFIRVAFAAEAVLTLFLALPLIFNPHQVLQQQYLDNVSAPTSPEAAALARWVGIFMLQTVFALVLGIPNRAGAIEVRRVVYITVAILEALWIPLVLWQAYTEGEAGCGMDPNKLIKGTVLPVSVCLVFRLWALFVKPDWLGRYRDRKKE